MATTALSSETRAQLFNPVFNVVPGAADKALLFTMSRKTGNFILNALTSGGYSGDVERVIRPGYGRLVLPDTTAPEHFATARLVKGRTIYGFLDQLRIQSECKAERIMSTKLQRRLGFLADTLVAVDPALHELTDRSGAVQYDPEMPSTLWQSSAVESYLHDHPIIAPQVKGNLFATEPTISLHKFVGIAPISVDEQLDAYATIL